MRLHISKKRSYRLDGVAADDARVMRKYSGAWGARIIIGPNTSDMIGEICLAIEMGADAVDNGKTIHSHPSLGETIGMAA